MVPFFLSLLFKDLNWILTWNADNRIITNSSCLTYDSNCFSTIQDAIIIEVKEAHYVYRKDACTFPFKYDNATFNSCTRRDGTTEGYPDEEAFWCATSVDADLNMQTWGFCNNFCPLEGTVQVF